MATTERQQKANRLNALKSTGPVTDVGKRKVSSNAMRHGVLSTKLLLADECAEDYQALLDELQHQLRPVGTLELVLVERIAISLWRQRRLVSAETAAVTLAMTPKAIAETVSDGMGLGRYNDNSIKPKDLEPPDQDQIEWCQAVIAECKDVAALKVNQWQQVVPLVFKQLSDDAAEEEMPVGEYLSMEGGMADYAENLVSWCEKELDKASRYEQMAQLAGRAVDKLSIPWGKLDIFTKYQAALDNQTYKAMKALREAQEWRLKTIEAKPALDAEENAGAA